MPRKDATGPFGRGPMTGRGMGPCEKGYGRGVCFGRFGYGYKRPTKEEEIEMLKAEKEDLKSALLEIEKRLDELK